MEKLDSPARYPGRRLVLSGIRRLGCHRMQIRLVLALLLAPALVAAFASAAVAQNVTWSIRLTYACFATPAPPGCDSVTQQATFTTLQAPPSGSINLTRQNGGKGVLSTFWFIERRNSGDFTIACADGSDLVLDTSKIFTVNGGYFSCNKVTVTGPGLNLSLSPAADGQGAINGATGASGSAIKGGYQFMARNLQTVVSQEYVTLSTPKVTIQNKWDSCIFSGFEGAPPSFALTGCRMRPGTTDATPWTLETLLAGITQCRAVCTSRLPE